MEKALFITFHNKIFKMIAAREGTEDDQIDQAPCVTRAG